FVLCERNGTRHFIGTPVESGRAPEGADEIEEALVKVCNAHRLEREVGAAPVSGATRHYMIEEIEDDLDSAGSVGNERCRETPRIDVESGVPRVIDPGRA